MKTRSTLLKMVLTLKNDSQWPSEEPSAFDHRDCKRISQCQTPVTVPGQFRVPVLPAIMERVTLELCILKHKANIILSQPCLSTSGYWILVHSPSAAL